MTYRKPTEKESNIVNEIGSRKYKVQKLFLIAMYIILFLSIALKGVYDFLIFDNTWNTTDWLLHISCIVLMTLNVSFFYSKNEKNYKKVKNKDYYVLDMYVKDVAFSRPGKTTYVNLKGKKDTPKIHEKAFYELYLKENEMGYVPHCKQNDIKTNLIDKKCCLVTIDHTTEYAILTDSELVKEIE